MAVAADSLPRLSLRSRLRRNGDGELAERVRRGDEDAFEAIYDRYHRGLLAFCTHMLGDRDEADDALQHVFASAYEALLRSRGEINLKPWLYTIARNRCLSTLRARRDEVGGDGLETVGTLYDGLAPEVQRRVDLQEIVYDLQRLPGDQRAALVLAELGDCSHEEIASVLNVRREKVKALVFQAREGLMRARDARHAACADIRAEVANLDGRAPRGATRSHVERCAACAAFSADVRRRRRLLAAIIPIVPSAGLKASILDMLRHGGDSGAGRAAAGGAVLGTGGVAGGAAGGAGSGAAGIAAAGGSATAGGLAGGGGAVIAAAVGAKTVVAKALAVAALGGGGSAGVLAHGMFEPTPPPRPAAAVLDRLTATGPAHAMRSGQATAPGRVTRPDPAVDPRPPAQAVTMQGSGIAPALALPAATPGVQHALVSAVPLAATGAPGGGVPARPAPDEHAAAPLCPPANTSDTGASAAGPPSCGGLSSAAPGAAVPAGPAAADVSRPPTAASGPADSRLDPPASGASRPKAQSGRPHAGDAAPAALQLATARTRPAPGARPADRNGAAGPPMGNGGDPGESTSRTRNRDSRSPRATPQPATHDADPAAISDHKRGAGNGGPDDARKVPARSAATPHPRTGATPAPATSPDQPRPTAGEAAPCAGCPPDPSSSSGVAAAPAPAGTTTATAPPPAPDPTTAPAPAPAPEPAGPAPADPVGAPAPTPAAAAEAPEPAEATTSAPPPAPRAETSTPSRRRTHAP
jgi:RNA polymerase sigma factor (sigma-70 family)